MHRIVGLGLLLVGMAVSPALADFTAGPYTASLTFTSDGDPNVVTGLAVSRFNMPGMTLTGVSVSVLHSGSATIMGDNDDPFKTCNVEARIVRQFGVTGTEDATFSAFGTKTITSSPVLLAVDNGDLALFDPNGPDGVNFGSLNYLNQAAIGSPYARPLAPYIGAGLMHFTVGSLLIVNDQVFIGPAPDAWQLQVEDPLLTVVLAVTYTYTPEPTSLSLLATGLLALVRRR